MGFTGRRFSYKTVSIKITRLARLKNYLSNVWFALKGSMERHKLYDFETKFIEDPNGTHEEFIVEGSKPFITENPIDGLKQV